MRRRSVCVLAACTAAVGLMATATAQKADGAGLALRRDWTPPSGMCATGVVREEELFARPMRLLADGRPISFEQDPPIVTPNYTGTITFRNFRVVGDRATVRFHLNDPDVPQDQTETWNRVATRTVNGRTVSVFEPSWPASTLARVMRRASWGWDYPALTWGEFRAEGVGDDSSSPIRLRFASTALPQAQVTRINDDVQFSSHIVNLRVPGFGESLAGQDDHDFDLQGVARRFYADFEDSYDTLAVVPQDAFLVSYSAFHRNVKNEVNGIGERIFDRSADYGSGGRLRSVEVYTQTSYASNSTSAHEIGHQWGSYIDWTRLTGLSRAGHQPEAHDPLWAADETLLGSVLAGTRRVKRNGDQWEIERTPAPIRFHPFMLYAMGLLPRERVAEITLFDDQAQFADNSLPDPGVTVNGDTRSATVFNVIGMLGERSGPAPSDWHRATVVVSRDRLLTQREMDYWTFFAQRLEDPNRSGVISYDGYGSFDLATYRGIDLKQDIRPKNAGKIAQALPVDTPEFGRDDWRDISFDAPVASRYSVGQRVGWSGRVTATDRSDFSQVLLRFWKYGGTTDDAVRVQGAVSSAGTFVIEHQFEDHHRGRYEMEVFLFWPNSGGQFPRAGATTIVIE